MDLAGSKALNHPNDMSEDSLYNSKFQLVQRIHNKDLEDIEGELVQGQ